MATCFTDEPPAFPGAHHESRNKFHIYAVGVARYTVHGRTFTTTQTDIFPRGRLIHEASPWNVISIDFSSRRVTKDESSMDKFSWNDEDVWRLQKGWTNDSVLETFLLFFQFDCGFEKCRFNPSLTHIGNNFSQIWFLFRFWEGRSLILHNLRFGESELLFFHPQTYWILLGIREFLPETENTQYVREIHNFEILCVKDNSLLLLLIFTKLFQISNKSTNLYIVCSYPTDETRPFDSKSNVHTILDS